MAEKKVAKKNVAKKNVAKKNVNVSVDDAHLEKFSDVVAAAKKAGLQVNQQMKELGVLTGSIESSKLSQLNSVEGVAHVESEESYQIAPPDSPIQ